MSSSISLKHKHCFPYGPRKCRFLLTHVNSGVCYHHHCVQNFFPVTQHCGKKSHPFTLFSECAGIISLFFLNVFCILLFALTWMTLSRSDLFFIFNEFNVKLS